MSCHPSITTFLIIYYSAALSCYTASNRGTNDSILNVRDYNWKISEDRYRFNRLSHVIYMFSGFWVCEENRNCSAVASCCTSFAGITGRRRVLSRFRSSCGTGLSDNWHETLCTCSLLCLSFSFILVCAPLDMCNQHSRSLFRNRIDTAKCYQIPPSNCLPNKQARSFWKSD